MRITLLLGRAFAITHRDLLAFSKTFWAEILASILTPVLIVVAFRVGIGDSISVEGMDYTVFLVAGVTMIPVMTSAFTGAGIETFLARKEAETFQEILTLPMPIESYALGRILSCASLGVIDGLVVGVVAILITKISMISAFILIIPLMFLAGVLFASLGIIGGMLVKWYYQFEAVSELVTLPLMFFCTIYFPLSSLSGIPAKIVYYLPLTPYVEVWRSVVVQGIPLGSLTSELTLAVSYPLFALVAAIAVVKWLSSRQ